RAGFYAKSERVVIKRQRRNFGSVIPLQVVPFPAVRQSLSRKIRVVADQVAVDALYTRVHDRRRQVVKPFIKIVLIKTRRKRHVAAAVNADVSGDGSVR